MAPPPSDPPPLTAGLAAVAAEAAGPSPVPSPGQGQAPTTVDSSPLEEISSPKIGEESVGPSDGVMERAIEDDLASVTSESFHRAHRYDGIGGAEDLSGDESVCGSSRTLNSRSVAVEIRSGDEEDNLVVSDEEDGFEGEEMEPPLKYERLAHDLRQVATDEKASAIIVHPRFLVVGTSWGNLHMYDSMGHSKVETQFGLHSHSVGVNQISVDHAGEYVASVSGVDGRVQISGLCSRSNTHDFILGRKVNAIALDPLYARAHPMVLEPPNSIHHANLMVCYRTLARTSFEIAFSFAVTSVTQISVCSPMNT